MDNEAKYLLAHDADRLFIKIIGTARYTNCSDFSIFVNRTIEANHLSDILVDLSETEFLDSTTLGLLAKLAGALFYKHERKMTLIAPREDLRDLLINTGFDRIMLILENPLSCPEELDELPDIEDVDKNMAKMMLDAHQTLMDLNECNHHEFKAVVEMLQAEVDKENK